MSNTNDTTMEVVKIKNEEVIIYSVENAFDLEGTKVANIRNVLSKWWQFEWSRGGTLQFKRFGMKFWGGSALLTIRYDSCTDTIASAGLSYCVKAINGEPIVKVDVSKYQ